MAESELQGIWIGLIIFCMFMMAGFGLLSTAIANDPSLASDEVGAYNSTFNKYDTVYANTLALEGQVSNTSAGTGSTGTTDNLIVASWNTLKQMPATLAIAKDVMFSLPESFGFLAIPFWVGGILVMLFIVVVIFAIYAAIFQRKP